VEDWRTRLDHWIRARDRLPEVTRECFPIRPPTEGWPVGVPRCPALADLYARCDGGTFGPFEFLPASEVSDTAHGPLAEAVGLEGGPGQWIHFGSHEYGHFALWHVATDQVALYSPDDLEPCPEGRTEVFLLQLFHPSAEASAGATQFWAEALAEADDLA
jgi:hypothetical protein